VDKICRMTVPEIRAHTRFLIEKCAPGGGWALGTGNSVANYVPVENFLAMLEEGYAAGFY
jgi:uroporphyrinogen decarboxylase